MKKLSAVVLLTVLVSCGKGEIVSNVKEATGKAVLDTVSTAGKALDDVFDTTSKAFDDAKNTTGEVITTVNDAKNTLFSNTGDFTESIGDAGESILQAPRKIGNALLGTNQDTDEELNSTQQDLEDLQKQVDAMYQEMLQGFSEASQELGELRADVTRLGDTVDQNQTNIVNALSQAESDFADEINRIDTKNAQQDDRDGRLSDRIRRVRRDLINLRSTVREIRYNVNHLEVFCETYVQRLGRSPVVTNVYTTCELIND